ncbi:carbonic anhydrase-related protein 10-like isoform X3 [Apis dorsata]|uniref:carbonic anhydrase-related protein 10-like isoform X3 n=1 Tax=Apis dorsata TaxID=7462 RepID=UPI001292E2A1|nr:carbonic anhydrase-related protein 10-like isoform X3 [Apis dorsata]
MCLRHLLLCLLGVIVIVNESEASWDEWWTYDGISGPAFWGLINPQWSLCSKGRRQSPINIEPDKLLFDRHLRPVLVDKHKVSGHLYNTGQFLVFRADREAKVRVNITGGPLAYHYQFEEIYIHYGMDNDHGSEHRINNYAFPAEFNDHTELPTDIFSQGSNRRKRRNSNEVTRLNEHCARNPDGMPIGRRNVVTPSLTHELSFKPEPVANFLRKIYISRKFRDSCKQFYSVRFINFNARESLRITFLWNENVREFFVSR